MKIEQIVCLPRESMLEISRASFHHLLHCLDSLNTAAFLKYFTRISTIESCRNPLFHRQNVRCPPGLTRTISSDAHPNYFVEERTDRMSASCIHSFISLSSEFLVLVRALSCSPRFSLFFQAINNHNCFLFHQILCTTTRRTCKNYFQCPVSDRFNILFT